MLTQLYNKNKFLFRISLFSILTFSMVGSIFIIDAIQKEDRNKKAEEFGTISSYHIDSNEYDISNMTNEERDELIKEILNKRENSEE